VARLPFDTPRILARYPEAGGVTHPAIRIAVGRWARRAVHVWHQGHPAPEHLLIGETPLVGERLMELARPRNDDLEPVLASAATLFLIPVPSRQVRDVIESARAREIAAPVHQRDAASAPPDLVRWHWDDLERVAALLGESSPAPLGVYDPERYARTYERLLRHRRSLIVPLTRALRMDASAHEVPLGATELVPTAAEVSGAIAEQMSRGDEEIEREAAQWYRV
jgi:hypothetical protein